jgi:hypothetical protein
VVSAAVPGLAGRYFSALSAFHGKELSFGSLAVRQGLDPQKGEFFRQRHGADRTASNGAEQSKARYLYDMTFSAPKSVSVMAIVGSGEIARRARDNFLRLLPSCLSQVHRELRIC